jgi:hypothetical protein
MSAWHMAAGILALLNALCGGVVIMLLPMRNIHRQYALAMAWLLGWGVTLPIQAALIDAAFTR